MIMIVYVLTLYIISAMAHPACIKRALTSIGFNTTWGTEILMASSIALVVLVLHMVDYFPLE